MIPTKLSPLHLTSQHAVVNNLSAPQTGCRKPDQIAPPVQRASSTRLFHVVRSPRGHLSLPSVGSCRRRLGAESFCFSAHNLGLQAGRSRLRENRDRPPCRRPTFH